MKKDLQELPKLRDSISFVYIEHAIIEQDAFSIVMIQKDRRIPVPIASTTCLLLGPGTNITHAAVKAIADNGCMVVWCGEKLTRFYASGCGETRSAKNLLRQAELCMDREKHLEVAKRMYLRRFGSIDCKDKTLQQLRGMEGIRVKQAYKLASKASGIPWTSRSYQTDDWEGSTPINRALSEANTLLYAICHAAIVSLGYSPGLGFIHTGKQLSFVYDVADLYKADMTIPAAFQAVRFAGDDLSAAVRRKCRDYFSSMNLLKRLPEDLEWIFSLKDTEGAEAASVGELWEADGTAPGGVNYGGESP